MTDQLKQFAMPCVNRVEVDQMKTEILIYVKLRPYTSMVELEDNVQGFKGNDCSWAKGDGNLVMWDSLSFAGCHAIVELSRDRQIVFEPCSPWTYMIDGRLPALPIAKRMPKGGYKTPHWIPLTLVLPDHKLSPVASRVFTKACQSKGFKHA